jgi:SAM-dependent methyltransferase
MTGAGSPRWTERAARHRHREFWEGAHSQGGAGGTGPSPLARWSEAWLPSDGRGLRLLERGYGTGTDLAGFVARGFTVAGIELARSAVGRARQISGELPRPDGVPRPILDAGDALEFLATQPDGSAAVVYANLFHSVAVPPASERRRWREVARVLAPGGLHIYSVRSTSDAWFGVGRRLGPSSFDPGPDGPPLRFYHAAEIERRVRQAFEPVARSDGTEGRGRYARAMLYAIDRRLPERVEKGETGKG